MEQVEMSPMSDEPISNLVQIRRVSNRRLDDVIQKWVGENSEIRKIANGCGKNSEIGKITGEPPSSLQVTNLWQFDALIDFHDESCPPNVESCDVCPELCRCIRGCEVEQG